MYAVYHVPGQTSKEISGSISKHLHYVLLLVLFSCVLCFYCLASENGGYRDKSLLLLVQWRWQFSNDRLLNPNISELRREWNVFVLTFDKIWKIPFVSRKCPINVKNHHIQRGCILESSVTATSSRQRRTCTSRILSKWSLSWIK